MLYDLLRPVTRLAFLAFYRRIRVSGRNLVPQGVPVIFTANHPTAFIEPCFLACYSGRNLHFMTRGDVFVNPWVHRLLRQVHLIPVFRFRDGYGNLKKNERSFGEARRVLVRNGAVLIMAEGGMRHEKRLRPIQRGAARLAFDAMEKDGLHDVWIQPVAVNYTAAERARSEMMVAFLPPFSARSYWEDYRERPQAALEAVTARIGKDLRSRVVHIRQPDNEELTEAVLELLRDRDALPWWKVLVEEEASLLREIGVADRIDRLSPVSRVELEKAWKAFRDALRASDMSIRELSLARSRKSTPSRFMIPVLRSIRLLALLPHALPVWLARTITARTVRIIEFRSSVLLGSLMFIGLFWWTICALLALSFLGNFGILAVLIVWPLSALLLLAVDGPLEALAASRLFHRLDKDQRIRLVLSREAMLRAWESAGVHEEEVKDQKAIRRAL